VVASGAALDGGDGDAASPQPLARAPSSVKTMPIADAGLTLFETLW